MVYACHNVLLCPSKDYEITKQNTCECIYLKVSFNQRSEVIYRAPGYGRNFPFRKQAMPFLTDLENFRTVIEILHHYWKCFIL